MPSVTANELTTAILDAFVESESPALLLSSAREHPRRFLVQAATGNVDIWVYAWTLTPGGRPSLPDEFRIQMTSVTSPLQSNPRGYTALIGYEPTLKMFAGFDLRRHSNFTTGSPSVQIDINCLHKALQDGLAFSKKGNNEIAIGVRPDQIVSYIANADELHRLGSGASTLNLLKRACALEIIQEGELASLPTERQRIVSTVRRLSRAANFRQQVLTAYDHRCAVTRIQLRLVDAAHILPVGALGSADHVQNGLALSPTFHRAFDNALIYLDEDLVMRISEAKALQLATLHFDGGLSNFRNFLDKPIHLPADKRQWPKVEFVLKANRHRRIL